MTPPQPWSVTAEVAAAAPDRWPVWSRFEEWPAARPSRKCQARKPGEGRTDEKSFSGYERCWGWHREPAQVQGWDATHHDLCQASPWFYSLVSVTGPPPLTMGFRNAKTAENKGMLAWRTLWDFITVMFPWELWYFVVISCRPQPQKEQQWTKI